MLYRLRASDVHPHLRRWYVRVPFVLVALPLVPLAILWDAREDVAFAYASLLSGLLPLKDGR